MSNWIKFRDRRPEMPGWYLGFNRLTVGPTWVWFNGCIFVGSDIDITHWMPSPEPPEQETRGPFSIIRDVESARRGMAMWHIKLGEARSPQLRTQRQAQEWCDFLNYVWSIKDIDNADISHLYRTVGSKLWLDGLMDSELKKIARDIYRPLLAFLWCNGFVDLPEKDKR